MGNDTSSPEDDDGYPDEFAKFEGIDTLGYRVLGVQPDSPASKAGLVSFLDFLVGANGKMLLGSGEELEEGDEYDDVDLPALLNESDGKEIELLVHNIKSDSQRLVRIAPSADWGGAGLLGVTIRLDDYGGADERLVRVLSVEHNSPAQVAGLVPQQDYLLGTASTSFDSDRTLAEVLLVHADRIVEMYVYSAESDVVRVVTLLPTYSWGGRGLLGAEVGTGYLHRFPKGCRGTDGTSMERKVRTGARPTETAAMTVNGKGEGRAPEAEEEGEREVLRTPSGQAMRFEEQMEMEQQEPSQPSAEAANRAPQNDARAGDNEDVLPAGEDAASYFNRPPPRPDNTGPGELPPPPYGSTRFTAHPPHADVPLVAAGDTH